MKLAALLIISLAWHGHWLSGRGNAIALAWSAADHPAHAVLVWQLQHGGVTLSHGQLPLTDKPATLTLALPEVRARTGVTWRYQLKDAKGGKVLEAGERRIVAYPLNMLAPLAERLGDTPVLVVDKGDELAAMLTAQKVNVRHVKDAADLRFAHAGVILVGPNQQLSAKAQQVLLNLAKAGARVMVFAQAKGDSLLGFALQRRLLPGYLAWRIRDPLLRGFRQADLATLMPTQRQMVHAIVVRGEDPDLRRASGPAWRRGTGQLPGLPGVVAAWPREVDASVAKPSKAKTHRDELSQSRDRLDGILVLPVRSAIPSSLHARHLQGEQAVPHDRSSEQASPIARDAMIVRQRLGTGCITLCQIPLGPWRDDPRSQLLLLNALDVLAQPR